MTLFYIVPHLLVFDDVHSLLLFIPGDLEFTVFVVVLIPVMYSVLLLPVLILGGAFTYGTFDTFVTTFTDVTLTLPRYYTSFGDVTLLVGARS